MVDAIFVTFTDLVEFRFHPCYMIASSDEVVVFQTPRWADFLQSEGSLAVADLTANGGDAAESLCQRRMPGV